MIGSIGNQTFEFSRGILADGNIEVDPYNSTAIIVMIRKDTPEGTSYLIVAMGDTENTNQQYNDLGAGLFSFGPPAGNWGNAPVLVDGIDAYITLSLEAENVWLYPLNPEGVRGDPLTVDELVGGFGLPLSSDNLTIWYEVVIAY